MRRLLPSPTAERVDGPAAYLADDRPKRADRPWVVLNMVVTVDGATAVEGRSGPMSSPGDRALFMALRAAADVIMVGARTARDEDYGPVRLDPELRAVRRSQGRPDLPILAVVSRSLDLDPAARLFADSDDRPLVLTGGDAPADRRRQLEGVATVVEAGTSGVDPMEAMAVLGGRGAQVVLCEGGPSLNAQLIAADLVDEVCVTTAPLLALGPSPRLAVADAVALRHLTLDRVLEEGGHLFCRYVRR